MMSKRGKGIYLANGKGWGRGEWESLGLICTLLYLKWITKVMLYSTGNSGQCYAAAWIGDLGGELSLFAVPLKLSQLC